MTKPGDILEPSLIGLSVLLYLSYHLFLWWKVRVYPLRTTIGQNHVIRRHWCHLMMKERRDITAVQTIRNALMTSSLMATTSLTLSAVVSAYTVTLIRSEGLVGLDLLAATYMRLIYKFLAIIIAFTGAFYFYMQSMRSGTHASYMVGLPADCPDTFVTPDYVAKVLKRGAEFHTAGTRSFYLAFLFVLWLFGPLPPLMVSIALVAHLAHMDSLPQIPTAQSMPSPAATTPSTAVTAAEVPQ